MKIILAFWHSDRLEAMAACTFMEITRRRHSKDQHTVFSLMRIVAWWGSCRERRKSEVTELQAQANALAAQVPPQSSPVQLASHRPRR